MFGLAWFLLGAFSTIGAEIAGVLNIASSARSDLESARAGFAGGLAELSARLDQLLAGVHLPF